MSLPHAFASARASPATAIYVGDGNAVVDRCLITDNGVSNYLVFDGSAAAPSSTTARLHNNIIDGGYVFEFGY